MSFSPVDAQKLATAKRLSKVRKCSDCDEQAFRSRKRCESCQNNHDKEYQREYHAKWGPKRRESLKTLQKCIHCQRDMPDDEKGRYRVCPICRDKMRETHRKQTDNGLCSHCRKELSRDGKKLCIACAENGVIQAQYNKSIMLKEYGSICICCGEEDIRSLTIDHINNDDMDERRAVDGGRNKSFSIYNHLKKLGWPKDGYQILCYNCNMGKANNKGTCPHKDNDYPLTVDSVLSIERRYSSKLLVNA